jgi:hypothetical protein
MHTYMLYRLARSSTRGSPAERLPEGWMEKLTFHQLSSSSSSSLGGGNGNSNGMGMETRMNVCDNRLFQRLALCFDLDKTGRVDWREVMMTLSLPPHLSLPSLMQLSQMWTRFCDKDTDNDCLLTRKQFLNTSLWFQDDNDNNNNNMNSSGSGSGSGSGSVSEREQAIHALKSVFFDVFKETYQMPRHPDLDDTNTNTNTNMRMSVDAEMDGEEGAGAGAGVGVGVGVNGTKMVELCDFRAFLLYLCYTDDDVHGLDKANSVLRCMHTSSHAPSMASVPSHLCKRVFKRASSARLSQFIKKDISHIFL